MLRCLKEPDEAESCGEDVTGNRSVEEAETPKCTARLCASLETPCSVDASVQRTPVDPS